jgi:hypothetical protein
MIPMAVSTSAGDGVDDSAPVKIDLQSAGAVMVIGHSQGAAVAPILLSHLLNCGLVNPMLQPVTFLGMAGIQHGVCRRVIGSALAVRVVVLS